MDGRKPPGDRQSQAAAVRARRLSQERLTIKGDGEMKFRIAVLFLGLGTLGAAGAERFYHISEATCDGWPRAPIGMAPGFCAGIVVAPPADFNSRTIRLPRV